MKTAYTLLGAFLRSLCMLKFMWILPENGTHTVDQSQSAHALNCPHVPMHVNDPYRHEIHFEIYLNYDLFLLQMWWRMKCVVIHSIWDGLKMRGEPIKYLWLTWSKRLVSGLIKSPRARLYYMKILNIVKCCQRTRIAFIEFPFNRVPIRCGIMWLKAKLYYSIQNICPDIP